MLHCRKLLRQGQDQGRDQGRHHVASAMKTVDQLKMALQAF
jgi:hypothetical protein